MNGQSTVEERLLVLRSLTRRAPTYSAISARTALIAGLLSILVATGIYLNNEGLSR